MFALAAEWLPEEVGELAGLSPGPGADGSLKPPPSLGDEKPQGPQGSPMEAASGQVKQIANLSPGLGTAKRLMSALLLCPEGATDLSISPVSPSPLSPTYLPAWGSLPLHPPDSSSSGLSPWGSVLGTG